MVHLKKIETRGFKSLGTKVNGTPVERGFVAITGPNGSGKSNLIDAILFALGENSAKTLRAVNLSSLIYDGAADEPKPTSTKVTLQFDNSDRRIPVDSDSVTLSRELKQSGESLYTMNGKHIQRNNLSDLLENALIASRGLNVVLQGMITRIAELVPDEKRKLIEQMVGIAQFDEKKNLAMQQLKEADVKLEVAMAKIGEIRDRVQLLEMQRTEMLRFKQLEEQITWLRAASSSAKLAAVRANLSQRREVVNLLNGKISELQGSLARVLKSIEEGENERSSLIRAAMDSGTAQIELELGKITNELNALKRDRQEAQEFIDKTLQVVPALAGIVEENRKKIEQREEQIASIQQQITAVEQNKKAQLLEELGKLNELRTEFQREFNAAQDKIEDAKKEKQNADLKLLNIREEHNALLSKLQSEKDKLASVQEKIKFYTEGAQGVQKSMEEIGAMLGIQRQEMSELQNAKSRIETLRKRVEHQLEIAGLIVEKTRNVVTKFDSDLKAMEAVAGEEIALARLESLGSEQALTGYIGPLRALINYDSEYSQAISAIGREWLNAIVVENVPSLIKITQSAKKLGIGRLIGVPLSEIRGLETSTRKAQHAYSHLEGIISPLTNVISCDRKLRRLVNFIFGDAVIVNSPRNAFLAAKRGFRAVTLQGDIFEPEIFAFETGYSKRYAKLSELLGKQQGFENIKDILKAFHALIDKRKKSLLELGSKAENFAIQERDSHSEVSKVEARLETTKAYFQRQTELASQLKDKIGLIDQEITNIEASIQVKQEAMKNQSKLCEEITARLDSMSLSAFNRRFAELGQMEQDTNLQLEKVTSELRELTTESIRAKADLENNLRQSLEHGLQQQVQVKNGLEAKEQFLKNTKEKLELLEASYLRVKEEEQKSLEKSQKFQPLLEALDQKLKELRLEETAFRKSLAGSEKELVTANLDIGRLLDGERQLLGELAMFGYAEPIETFEGASELAKQLEQEYSILKNNVNLIADRNYREVFENYKYSSTRKNDLEKERNAIVTFIETIDAEKRRVFMEAFERIDKELRLIFNKITDGAGWLEIENPDTIFDSGIFLMTQFPGKLPRDSSAVSGGEKTISALSFILAIQAVFPSPFYVFDEVDAHLDSKYSGRLADILAERSDRSQIIIVSLKDNVVAKASSVIGVYMANGSSRILRYRSPMEVRIPNEPAQ